MKCLSDNIWVDWLKILNIKSSFSPFLLLKNFNVTYVTHIPIGQSQSMLFPVYSDMANIHI